MALSRIRTTFLVVFFLLAFAGCSNKTQNGAAAAIQAYYQALVAKDADRLATLSCADWEDDAKTELESFGAVKTSLENVECEQSGQDGELAIVNCSGKISADYNGEILEINLADRTYLAQEEGDEWRMCGYR
jgi:hypothetical protein